MTHDEEAAEKYCEETGTSKTTFLAGCAHARKELESKLAEAERKLGIAVEALKSYADESLWNDHTRVVGKIFSRRQMSDVGFINSDEKPAVLAREALERIEGKG